MLIMEYNIEALSELQISIDKFKKWNGINTLNWGKYFHKESLNLSLDIKFTRNELLNNEFIKELSSEELAIAILSWGGMNREHGKSLFNHKEWIEIIDGLKNKKIKSRKEAYELFKNIRKKGKLKGMGPAYFTKLICFVSPNLNGYIMDQWTSKSINLLFDNKTVFLYNNGNVTDKNTAEIYEDFCRKIEYLADLLKLNPIDLEENLFSNGGINKGKWRRFVVDNWNYNVKSKSTKKVQIINDIEMEPITFEDVLNKLKGNETVIPTLGGRSKLKIKVENNLIYIINSKNNQLAIDEKHWNKVMNRLEELPQHERGMTSRYGVGNHAFNWDECPNQVFSIYIPAIVKHLSK
jgi:hypothetical protein